VSAKNIFRQAKLLLDKKDASSKLPGDEFKLVSLATAFVANEMPKAFPEYEGRTVREDLEELIEILEEVAHD